MLSTVRDAGETTNGSGQRRGASQRFGGPRRSRSAASKHQTKAREKTVLGPTNKRRLARRNLVKKREKETKDETGLRGRGAACISIRTGSTSQQPVCRWIRAAPAAVEGTGGLIDSHCPTGQPPGHCAYPTARSKGRSESNCVRRGREKRVWGEHGLLKPGIGSCRAPFITTGAPF